MRAPYYKPSAAQIDEAIRLRESGASIAAVCKRFGGSAPGWEYRFLQYGAEVGGTPRYRPAEKPRDRAIAEARASGDSSTIIARRLGLYEGYVLQRLLRIARRDAFDEAAAT